MKQIISFEILRIAETLRLAQALTPQVLDNITKTLVSILKDQKNFDPAPGIPLQFSPAGLQKITKLGYSPRIAKDMMSVIKMLDNAITLAGNTGNEEMSRLAKALSRSEDQWINIKVNNMEFDEAKGRILRAFDHLHDLAQSTSQPEPSKMPVSPEELKEMQEKGVMPVR